MKEKYLWPLIGILMGWFLTNLAAGWRDREDKRRRVGRTLSMLMHVYNQIGVLKSTCEIVQETMGSPESYEKERKRLSEKHFLEDPSLLENLKESIDDISGIYPLESLEYQGLLRTILKLKEVSFKTMSTKVNLYIQAISFHEVSIDICEKALIKCLRSLAFKHSIVTYFKVLYILHKSSKHAEKNYGFLNDFLEEAVNEAGKNPK